MDDEPIAHFLTLLFKNLRSKRKETTALLHVNRCHLRITKSKESHKTREKPTPKSTLPKTCLAVLFSSERETQSCEKRQRHCTSKFKLCRVQGLPTLKTRPWLPQLRRLFHRIMLPILLQRTKSRPPAVAS